MIDKYSLTDVLGRMYQNQIAIEAAILELALQLENQGLGEVGKNVRSALDTIYDNSASIKGGLDRLRNLP